MTDTAKDMPDTFERAMKKVKAAFHSYVPYEKRDLWDGLIDIQKLHENRPQAPAEGEVAEAVAWFDHDNEDCMYADGTMLGGKALKHIETLIQAATRSSQTDRSVVSEQDFGQFAAFNTFWGKYYADRPNMQQFKDVMRVAFIAGRHDEKRRSNQTGEA